MMFFCIDVSRSTLVGQGRYKITLVRLSIRLSVRPSLNFLKIGSLLFSDIVHDELTMIYSDWQSQSFEKKFDGPNLDSRGLN